MAVFDAEWIRQAAEECAETIRSLGLRGDSTLAAFDDLPAEGSFTEEEAVEVLAAWVATGHKHHQFLGPSFLESVVSGEDDNGRALPPLDLPTGGVHDGVGIVTVPGLKHPDSDSVQARRYTETLSGLLYELDPDVEGWVLDFASKHTGGNAHPMTAGLFGLLGEGRLYGFVSATGDVAWVDATDTAILNGGEPAAWVLNARPLPPKPIAVLTGPLTRSAGEFVVLALRSKVGARLFGAPTGGYLTGVQLVPLKCGAGFGVTTTEAVDRDGHPQDDHLVPDEIVPPDEHQARAMSWIKSTA